MQRVMSWSVMLAVVVAVGGLTRGASAQPQTVTVYMYNFDFSVNLPGEPVEDAVINVGDIVEWVPLNEFHNTVAAMGQAEYWESDILGLDDTFEWVFSTPGVYNYYCAPHGQDNGDGTVSGMGGTITVLPAPGGALALGMAAAVVGVRRRRRLEQVAA